MSSPDQQLETMLANIPEKTGKSLSQWIDILTNSNLTKHGQIVKYLKSEHGVTHGFANLIAAKTLETDQEIDLVDAQYGGPKTGLRAVYEEISKYAISLGNDVELAPKKASVSLRRKKQFALITPATKTRIYLGLALKGELAKGRLETYNAMCSHRIRIEQLGDFDQEVKAWMSKAYENAG